MTRFAMAFANFILLAAFCAVGVVGIIFALEADSYSRAGVIREGSAGGTRLADPGAQEAQSRPRTGEARTGQKGLAKSLNPGYACCQPVPVLQKEQSREVGSTHGVRYVPARSSEQATLLRESGRGSFQSMATAAAALCGVPPALLHALVARESSWRQWDRHGRVLRSTSGALGLTQIKASTAREVGPSDPHQPFGNLLLGSCYLRRQFDRFGTWERALLAYRLGPRGLSTREARAYVSDIMEGSAQ